MEPEEFGKLVKKILSDPKKVYVIALIGIVIFPPTEMLVQDMTEGGNL